VCDFEEFVKQHKYEKYLSSVNRFTMDNYGFNADQAYPKTTERIALACFDEHDEPAIAGTLIAEHHNAPRLLEID
jgi:hypothetical protein